MNKIVKFLGCIALGAFVLTSCVKNEESEGVKALRDAKAREINADAAGQEITNLTTELNYLKDKAKWDASKDVQIQTEIAEKQATLLDKQIALYKKQVGETNDKVTALQSELTEIRTSITTISKALYGEDGTAGGLVVTIANLTKAINDQKEVVDNASPEDKPIEQAKLTALNSQKTQLQSEMDSKVKELGVLQKRLDSLTAEIEALFAA